MKRLAVIIAALSVIASVIQAATYTSGTIAIPAGTTKELAWLTPGVTGVTVSASGGLRVAAIADPRTNLIVSTDNSVTGIVVMSGWTYVYTGDTTSVQYDYNRIFDANYKKIVTVKNTNASAAGCTVTLATE
mgnify:CR=1 FL=1